MRLGEVEISIDVSIVRMSSSAINYRELTVPHVDWLGNSSISFNLKQVCY